MIIGSIYFNGGTGTIEDPYQITNIDQLQNINQEKSAHYIQMNDIDASVTKSWNDGKGFDPIGAHYNPSGNPAFTGTFDGQNYTISNLYINRPDEINVALFGGTSSGAVIKNLKITNCEIEGYQMTAGAVGSQYQGNIYNVCVIGKITGHWEDTAGIVGWSNGNIKNCYAIGIYEGADSAYRIGGIAGYLYTGSVQNSYSIAVIRCSNSWTGGFAGAIRDAVVTSCYWDKEISGQTVSGGGTGLTTAEMKMQESYVGWDFDNIWNIDSNINNGYPYLIFNVETIQEPAAPSEDEEEIVTNSSTNDINPVIQNSSTTVETSVLETIETEEISLNITETTIDESSINDKTSINDYMIYILVVLAILALFSGFYIEKRKGD